MQSAKLTAAKGPKILAKSFFKELRDNGYDCNQILAVSTELIELVTQELKGGEGTTKAVPAPPQQPVKVLPLRQAQ